jgi:hypothetical protein
MGRIIRFSADRHRELRELLPWYITGQLSGADRERVEAHLPVCAECRSEVRFEQRLDEEVSRMPVDIDQSWERMRARVERDRPAAHGLGRMAGAITLPAWSGWAAASLLFLSTGVLLMPGTPRPGYHVLSSKAVVASPGNVAVIFRPDTRERDMRKALIDSGARLVDGPTAAGGYILYVPAARQTAALAKLRARADVEMAEGIDPGPSR